MATLTIHREGSFELTVSGPNHCGAIPAGTSLQVKYSFKCTCESTQVDNRGFLFDQLNVQKYFDGLSHTTLSCEELTHTSARALYRLIRRENVKLNPSSLHLTLSPAPYAASMEFNWKGGNV